MLAKLEGILFLCGDEGMLKDDIKKILQIDDLKLMELIKETELLCQDDKRGIEVKIFGDIVKFVTKKGNEEVYKQLVHTSAERPLTPTMLEALAIIAYNQPITRIEIDQIRGVSSFHLIRRLLMKELIEEAGRSTTPGRPIIYKTTSKFLDALGISSLNDLPIIEPIVAKDEIELFANKSNVTE